MNKEYILFDLDGTLTDPKIGITKSTQYALAHFGINTENPDDLCKHIGPPIRTSFKEYGLTDAEVEEAVSKYRERFVDVGIYENTMYQGVDEMLQKLQDSGKTLILATSKVAAYAQIILEHFNLAKFFTFVSGSELNGDRSEKSEVIQYALDQNNISDLSKCIMIGDRKYDIVGAKAIGIDSIGVLYGYGDYEELSQAGADHIVKDVDALSDLLHTRLF